MLNRRASLAALALLPFANLAVAQTTPDDSHKAWESLKKDVVGDVALLAETGVILLNVPKRAQDAGLVPVDIALDPAKAGAIKKLILVIDVNPSPVAATFTFGPDAGVRHISTRIRVNDYSFVRAIAETDKGEFHMTEKFVKASGGCSAPAVKNPAEAKATLGVMRLKQFGAATGAGTEGLREAELMIRHPNNSGFQMDQLTRNFIPPHFINDLTISQGGAKIFDMQSGISISEDPNLRFDYKPNGANEIEANAVDTEGLKFNAKWPVDVTGSAQ